MFSGDDSTDQGFLEVSECVHVEAGYMNGRYGVDMAFVGSRRIGMVCVVVGVVLVGMVQVSSGVIPACI